MPIHVRVPARLRTVLRACSAPILAASLAFSAPAASAQTSASNPATPVTLNVVGFEGAFNLPVWVAQQRGFFAANGLNVNLSFPAGSVAVIQDLNNGSAQLALMSVDNVLAYRRSQGGSNAPQATDLVVFMGGDHGNLSLVARPGIHTVRELRGSAVSVDAMTTGFAFVLHHALAAHQVRERELKVVAVGGTGYRYRALVADRQDATLLRTPFEFLAEEQGFNLLLSADQLTPDYLGTIGAVRSSWAAAHPADMTGFLIAYHEALNWIFDPQNKPAALAILHGQYPTLTQQGLLETYQAMTSHRDGLIANMTIDRAGLAEVEKLRNEYAPLAHPTAAQTSIVDLSYLRAAQSSPGWK
jgi:ABC-type nitrate/sulfonate/bicarbonate transport system substrate-binding protein